MKKQYTHDEVLAELKARVAASTQRAVAAELGISFQLLNDLVRGRRDISENIAEALGFEKTVLFRRSA